MPTSCIYTITCKSNDKIYIGFTIDFQKRVWRHISSLRNGKHDNEYLQSAWNKYEEEDFLFEVLEECNEEFLTSLEHYWCNLLNTHDRKYGYNLRLTHPEGRVKLSEETKNKISKKNRGRKRTDNTWKGRHHTLESKLKISEAKRGKKTKPHSEEAKIKISESNKKVKRVLSKEHLEKMINAARATNTGRKRIFTEQWINNMKLSHSKNKEK